MKKFFILATVLMFCVTFVPGVHAQSVKVGALMSMTGPLQEFGPNIFNGAKLAAKQITDAGFTIDVIMQDTQTSAIPGINAAKKLVQVDKVPAIVGAISSGVTIPVAESVTIPNSVVLMSPSATSPLISVLPADQGKDFLFRTAPSDALQGVVLGQLAATYNKTASVIYVNNPYGQGLAEQFKKSFEYRHGKVLAMVPIDEKVAETYTAELKKALAGKPDRLCAFTYPQHAMIYLKEAIEFFHYKHFLFCDGTKSEDIIKALGAKNVDGQMGTVAASPTGEAVDLFNADYKAAYGKLPPLPYITNAYDAMAVIGLAAYAANLKGLPLTGTNVRNYLRVVANPPGETVMPGQFKKALDLLKQGKEINYDGAGSNCNFDKNGDVQTPIEIWKYSDGKIVTVRTVWPIPKI